MMTISLTASTGRGTVENGTSSKTDIQQRPENSCLDYNQFLSFLTKESRT